MFDSADLRVMLSTAVPCKDGVYRPARPAPGFFRQRARAAWAVLTGRAAAVYLYDGSEGGTLHPWRCCVCGTTHSGLSVCPRNGAVLEELANIRANAPLWPGDTLSHKTAYECVRRGLAKRDSEGNFVPANAKPEPGHG